MFDTLKQVVEYFWWPGMLILFLVLVIIIFAVYKLGSIKEKVSAIDKTNDNIDTIKSNISELTWNVRHILSRLDAVEGANSALAQRHSPIRLTEKWEQLLASTIKPYIDRSFNDIWEDYSDIQDISNPFDIEQFAKRIALDVYDKYTSENEKDKIKSAMFIDGATMSDLNLITWIYLRNKFFEIKWMKLEDLDTEKPLTA